MQTRGAGPESDRHSGAERRKQTPRYLKYSSKPMKDPKPTPQLQPPSQKDLNTHQFPKNQASRPYSSQMALFPQCGEQRVESGPCTPRTLLPSPAERAVALEADPPGVELILGGAGPSVFSMDDTPCCDPHTQQPRQVVVHGVGPTSKTRPSGRCRGAGPVRPYSGSKNSPWGLLLAVHQQGSVFGPRTCWG